MNVNNIPPQPPYALVVSENAYVKHVMAYQHQLIEYHQNHAANLYQDAMRWRHYKATLEAREGAGKGAEVQKQVDDRMARKS